jgi:hypothetical protein
VSSTPDQISDDEVPRLHVTSPPQPFDHAVAPLPADRDDDVPISRFSHRTALVSCYDDAEVPLLRPGVSCLLSSSPSLRVFSLNLPCRLAAAADALSGMVVYDLLLLRVLRVLPAFSEVLSSS